MPHTLRYSLIGAYEAGHTAHPQREMEKLGYEILNYEGGEIGDCVFIQVKEPHPPLPDFLTPCNYQFTEDIK
jgi:hypothetical protein